MESSIELITLNSTCSLTSDLGKKLLDFCQEADRDNCKTALNLKTIDWQKKSETLLYCLYNEKRFDSPKGELFAVISEGVIASVGGIYLSDFYPQKIAIGACRTYTRPSKRSRFWQGDFILPAQVAWALKNNIAQILFTINHDNQKVQKFLEKCIDNKLLGAHHFASNKVYMQLEKHPRPVLIKNTLQNIFKLTLDKNFNWDYSSIEQNPL